MSGLENLKSRLNYNGGSTQEGRMNLDKLRTLKKTLLYSYQAVTAILADGREFRCLINPDKLKESYDDKIISIPYKDICIGKIEINEDGEEIETINKPNGKTSEKEETIGLKAGDIFKWKENNSYWLVFLQRLEETAYFRAEIRRCQYEVEINDNKYKVYVKGPSESSIIWHTKSNQASSSFSWNDLNYDVEMYITKNEETEAYFHRFSKIKIKGKPYEVQGVDNISTEGIIVIALKEYYQNTIEDNIGAAEKLDKPSIEEKDIYIVGDTEVYPYDEKHYEINDNTLIGTWTVDNKKVFIKQQNEHSVDIEILTGRSGEFNLIYKQKNKEDIIQKVIIKSL